MKDFFKKIWEAIKAFFASVYEGAVKWLKELPSARYVYFIIGLYLTAAIAIVFHGAIEWPFIPVVVFFFIIGFIRTFCDKPVFWWNYLAACIGAIAIQVLCWIA